MADRGVIVRRLAAIENLGSDDFLCIDKTGTLTRGVVDLSAATDPAGQTSDQVLRLAQINAALETGIENPLDAGIVASAAARGFALPVVQKIDEISHDFLRKRLTIVVKSVSEGQHLMISKGAFDGVLACCDRVQGSMGPEPLDDSARARLIAYYAAQGAEGFRMLGVATGEAAAKAHYSREDEIGLVFEGFLGSSLVNHQSQNNTTAARAMAEKKTLGHLSQRVATRRQSFKRPNIISILLRRLYRRLSYLTGTFRDFRPGMHGFICLFSSAALNQSAS